MVRYCCVNGCNNKSHDGKGRKLNNGARFFRFPTWKKSHGQQVEEITKRRRMAWVAAVRRKNITFAKISPFMYVCSRHFHKGQPAYEMMEADPDWAPSLHLGHADTAPSARPCKREQMRKSTQPAEAWTRVEETREAAQSYQVQAFSVKEEPSAEHPEQSHAGSESRPQQKPPLPRLQRSVERQAKPEGRLQKRVFSEKENTPLPCSEVDDKLHCKAGKRLQTYQITGIFKSGEVLVSMQCLLELFRCCSVCLVECCVTVEDHESLFYVVQDCQSCGHHREWRSHPTPEEEPVEALYKEDQDCGEVSYSEVEVQIVSSDSEGNEQSYTQMLTEKDWSRISTSEEELSEEEEEKKEKGKKPEMQDSSEKREAQLGEADTDLDVSVDEDLLSMRLEDVGRRLAVWCSDCGADAVLSCSMHHHTRAFICCRCGPDHGVDQHGFHEAAVCFFDFGSFQRHVEKEHGARLFYTLCRECGMFTSAEAESSGRKDYGCEHETKSIICPGCGKRFLSGVCLKRDDSKLLDAAHLCKYCLMVFKNRPSTLEHGQTLPKEKQLHCCLEGFENISEHSSHLESHRGPPNNVWDTCG